MLFYLKYLFRNLYVIDYLAQHGPRPANEFKTIWDNLDRKILKVSFVFSIFSIKKLNFIQEYQSKSAAANKNAKSVVK